MPIYEIHHSYPFKGEQKHRLAQAITKLHARTFVTPSFFVHVIFKSHDASDRSYFIAGEARVSCTNRISAQVRTSSTRSKADFDKLAEQIEEVWYDVIKGEKITKKDDKNFGKRPGEVEESSDKAEAERLLMVSFYPMIAAREAGMVIPEAGKEAEFFKEWKPYMKKMSDEKGLNDFKEMLHELETREDLKSLNA